jgi:hybrid cluster-associated redox disulfide protein
MIKIDPEMTIQELLSHHSGATTVFIKRRMMCVGCPAQAYHTLEDVVRIHGCALDALCNAIREAIESNAEFKA